MALFMAGATKTGARVARMVVVNISSAMPFAALPRKLAEAGATKKASACFAREICSTSQGVSRLNISVITGAWDMVSRAKGVINWPPALVRITRTCTSCLRKRLIISQAL